MSQINKYEFLKDLPNQLTLFRIAAVPLLLVLFPIEIESLRLFCAALFALAAATDWLDGFIARRFSLESKIGALLDPIADKLLTGAALILLASTQRLWPWLAGILLSREIAISGLRLLATQLNYTLDVSIFGKFKTLILDVAFVCLMVNQPLFGWPFQEVGMISLWLGTFMSLYSGLLYIKAFSKEFRKQEALPSNPPKETPADL